MKHLASILFFVVGAYVVYKFFLERKPDALDEHLTEQANLREISKVAGNASIQARPAVASISSRGPLDGVIANPLDRKVEFNDVLWMPTGWGGITPVLPILN